MQPLLSDTEFVRGFGISPRFSEGYADETPCLHDASMRPLHSFPPDAVDPVWYFEEGCYRDYTDEDGNYVKELFEHRFNTVGEVISDTADQYEIGVFNKRTSVPKPICSIATNRRGSIRMFFNTHNMIRNVANSHEPRFKNDTWPHFLLCQHLPELRMARYASVHFSITAKLINHRQLSDQMAHGPVPEKANFLSYFHLTNRNTGEPLWIGICMYTSCGQERFYDEIMSVDQHGTGMYRVPMREHGTPLIEGEEHTFTYDLRKALERILEISEASITGVTTDDFEINGFNVGWECIGDHETIIECTDLSVTGVKKQQA